MLRTDNSQICVFKTISIQTTSKPMEGYEQNSLYKVLEIYKLFVLITSSNSMQ